MPGSPLGDEEMLDMTGLQAHFGAGGMGKILVVCGDDRRIFAPQECSEVGVASLGDDLAGGHFKIAPDNGVKPQGGVRKWNLRVRGRERRSGPGRSGSFNLIWADRNLRGSLPLCELIGRHLRCHAV